MSDDLVTWLRVQLDADEQVGVDDVGGVCDGGVHLDRDRWLREVEAKRRIVERYEFVTSHGPAVDQTRALDMTTGAAAALADVLKLLALPYSDRPGWVDAWRP